MIENDADREKQFSLHTTFFTNLQLISLIGDYVEFHARQYSDYFQTLFPRFAVFGANCRQTASSKFKGGVKREEPRH